MSTNDMLLCCQRIAKNEEIKENTPEYRQFLAALEYVLIKLAKMIARDGEGATKFIEIFVYGAKNRRRSHTSGASRCEF